jgi:hypothetical protein
VESKKGIAMKRVMRVLPGLLPENPIYTTILSVIAAVIIGVLQGMAAGVAVGTILFLIMWSSDVMDKKLRPVVRRFVTYGLVGAALGSSLTRVFDINSDSTSMLWMLIGSVAAVILYALYRNAQKRSGDHTAS